MNDTPDMDPLFSSALRAALTATVEGAPRRRRRWRWRLSAGAVAGVIVVGGGAAIAATVLSPPGAPSDTALGNVISVSHTGTATVDLGLAPPNATDISLTLTCLSAGTFNFPDGAIMTCTTADASTPGNAAQSTDVVPVQPGQDTVTINATSGAAWTLRAVYLNRVTTSWGTNTNGQTYGVPNKNGTPDLVAVTIDHGQVHGYVKASDLNCASGADAVHSPSQALAWSEASKNRNIAIPVYESDGTTPVGTFVVGDATGPQATTVPLSAVSSDCSTENGP